MTMMTMTMTMTTMMINKKKQKTNITIMSALKLKPTINLVDCPNVMPLKKFTAMEHINKMKRVVLILAFMVSGFAWSQTTVTLQDQCNCEVLSGTSVSAPGVATPTGADTGDIYVNTSTGTIYFWDGDSWELTSTDTNTTNASFYVNGTDLVMEDSAGDVVTVALADIAAQVNTDDQDASEVIFDDTASGLGTTDVQAALDALALSNAADGDTDVSNEIQTLTSTDGSVTLTQTGNDYDLSVAAETLTTLTDNGDGTFTYTNEDGTATTFDSRLATVTDNADGTFDITDDSGTTITIDTNNTVTTLTDNADGSFTYTSEDGTVTTFTETTSTLVDNTDGTFTYTDEDGTATTFDGTDDQNASEVSFDNTVSGVLSATNVQDAIDEAIADGAAAVQANTTLINNHITADEDTNATNELVDLDLTANILTLSNPATAGNQVDLSGYLDNTDDQDASEVAFTPTGNTTSTDVQAAIEELQVDIDGFAAVAGQTNTASNQGAGGVGVFLQKTGADLEFKNINAGSNLITVVNDAANNEIDIDINEANLTITESQISDLNHTVNTDAQTIALDGATNILALGNGTGADTTVDLSGYLDNTDAQTLSITGDQLSIANGNAVTIPTADGTETSVTAGANVTVTGDGSSATPYVIASTDTDDQTAAEVSYSNTTSGLTATDTQAAIDEVAAGSTDDQNLTLLGNTLSIEDGNDVDLSSYLDNTDDQDASEVNIVTAVDVNGDSTNETTVEEAIQAMAPIVSKAARIFYPPSIAIDASATGTGFTIDLYAQYIAQFGSPTVASAGAPAAVPTYARGELYYYVTYADPDVFGNGTNVTGMSIDANGILTYNINASPADYNSLINVVFVVQ